MESINNWIKNKGTYAEGLALYATTAGMKPTLLKLLQKAETAQNLEKLTYELKKAAPVQKTALPVIKPVQNVTKEQMIMLGRDIGFTDYSTIAKIVISEKKQPEAAPEPEVKNTLLFHQLPPELRQDLLVANNLYRENCLLKVQLNELLPEQEEEALQLQLQIFANLKKNRLHWQRIDYWQEHKRLPAPLLSKAQKLNPSKQVKRQQYLFSSRSKLRKRIEANKIALENATTVHARTRIAKMLAKQEANLLQQEHNLQELTTIIDRPNEQ